MKSSLKPLQPLKYIPLLIIDLLRKVYILFIWNVCSLVYGEGCARALEISNPPKKSVSRSVMSDS